MIDLEFESNLRQCVFDMHKASAGLISYTTWAERWGEFITTELNKPIKPTCWRNYEDNEVHIFPDVDIPDDVHFETAEEWYEYLTNRGEPEND